MTQINNHDIQQLMLAVNLPRHGLVIFDTQGTMIGANQEARTFFPFLEENEEDGETLTLQSFLNYIFDNSEDCDAGIAKAIEKMRMHTSHSGFSEVVRTQEGLCLVESYRQTNQELTVVSIKDIESLREVHDEFAQLSAYTEILMNAFHQATSGIVVIDVAKAAMPIVFSNMAFDQFFHLDNAQNASFKPIIEKSFSKDVAQDIAEAIICGEGFSRDLETHPGNETKYCTLKFSNINSNRRKGNYYVGVITDRTEIRLKEQEINTFQKFDALGQLAAGIAHDFNNILSIINGFTTIGQKITEKGSLSKEDLGELQTSFSKIKSASDRGAAIVRKVMSFSRKKVDDNVSTNISEVVSDMDDLLQRLVTSPRVLDMQIKDPNIWITLSEDHLTQLLINLVANARDAIEDKGTISVSIDHIKRKDLPATAAQKYEDKDLENFVIICVADTGTGMDSETLASIFDPFFTTKDQGAGTGLGLSIVYNIVNNAAGAIDIISQPGQGTKISLFLPSAEPPEEETSVVQFDHQVSRQYKNKTVLLVDDEDDLRMIVRIMLQDMGFTVIEACNGDDALLKQDEFIKPIDLLLTDVVMPELDGVGLYELFHALRPESKIIFMTGFPGIGKSKDTTIPKGMPFLRKPFETAELTQIIDDVFNKAKQEQSEKLYGSKGVY